MNGFRVGDRVRINYGPGTVVAIYPDQSGQGRAPLICVHADIGQAWFRVPEEIDRLDDETGGDE